MTAANAEALSSELEATTSADNITNRLDIQFTVNAIENIVNSNQTSAEVRSRAVIQLVY